MDLMLIGRVLSHYRVIERLGAGGMGEVYRAHDDRLERDVALKVLSSDLLGDEVARRRLRREARVLSRLSHPGIGMIFDFDSEGGIDFLIMELIPGSTLEDRLRSGPLAEAEVLKIGGQVAGALAAAHEQGVVHGDLKPSNIVVTPDGQSKVIDFGIARLLAGARPIGATTTGLVSGAGEGVPGTVPYMAPEQLLGGEIDGKTDIHALGVVLFELATGRLPHVDAVPMALVYRIVHETPPRARALKSDLSESLDDVITRCLAKDPAARPPSASALETELDAIARGRATPVRRSRRKVIAFSAGAAIAVCLMLVLVSRPFAPRGAGAGTIRSLVVLPLTDPAPDAGTTYFAEGMTDELTSCLSQISALTVISRSSAKRYQGTAKSVKRIAQELHVDGVITGTVAHARGHVRVIAELVQAANERQIWSGRYERRSEDVLAIQNELASAIAREVRVELTPRERSKLAESPVVNPRAYDAYLRGRTHAQTESSEELQAAIRSFNEAIAAEPRYAAAYGALATTYSIASSDFMSTDIAMPRARAAAVRALEIDPDLATAHAALGTVLSLYDRNPVDGERELHRAVALNPGDPFARQQLGVVLELTGRFGEASRELERALELDPFSEYIGVTALWPSYHSGRYAETLQRALALEKRNPDRVFPSLWVGMASIRMGDFPHGIAKLEEVLRREPIAPAMGFLGHAYGLAGRRADAQRMIARLASLTDTVQVSPYIFALVYAGLGERDSCFAWLDRGYREHDEGVMWIGVDPAMATMRSDPRYGVLARKLGVLR